MKKKKSRKEIIRDMEDSEKIWKIFNQSPRKRGKRMKALFEEMIA